MASMVSGMLAVVLAEVSAIRAGDFSAMLTRQADMPHCRPMTAAATKVSPNASSRNQPRNPPMAQTVPASVRPTK